MHDAATGTDRPDPGAALQARVHRIRRGGLQGLPLLDDALRAGAARGGSS